MKNILSILMLLMVISFTKAQITTTPSPPEANQAVVINFDNTKSLNKVLFAGYPETLKDLIIKLKEANKGLTKHFNKEIE